MTHITPHLPRHKFVRLCVDEVLTRFADDFAMGAGYAYDVMLLVADINDHLRLTGQPFYRWGRTSLDARHLELVRVTDQVMNACSDILLLT